MVRVAEGFGGGGRGEWEGGVAGVAGSVGVPRKVGLLVREREVEYGRVRQSEPERESDALGLDPYVQYPDFQVDLGGDLSDDVSLDHTPDLDTIFGDPEAQDTETLGESIVTLSAHLHAGNHRLLVMVAEFDRRGGWKPAGHRSCAHWLAFRTGISLGPARERVRAARALENLPVTSEAMSRGELSFSKVRALSRVVDDLATPEEEETLVEYARQCTAAQLETLVRGWKKLCRKDEIDLERERHRSRFFSVSPDEDGMYQVRGRLDPEVGALLMRALEAAGDALFKSERDWAPEGAAMGPAVREITPRQRRADGMGLLVEQALRVGFGGVGAWGEGHDGDGIDRGDGDVSDEGVSAATPNGAESDSDNVPAEVVTSRASPLSGTRPERYQVVLHVDMATLRTGDREVAGCCGEAVGCHGNAAGCHGNAAGCQGNAAGCSGDAVAGNGETAARRSHAPCNGSRPTDAPSHAHFLEHAPGRSHLSDGTRVPAETSRRLCCDAAVVEAVRGPDGEVLDVGRRTRTIPPALRRALEIRDGGCRFPGCGLRFGEGHHIVHWADGGETKLSNLVLLCRFHHRAVHEEGFTVKVVNDRIRFFDRLGWPLPDVAPPPPLKDPFSELLARHRREGVSPHSHTPSARWKRSTDIPWQLEARVREALDSEAGG